MSESKQGSYWISAGKFALIQRLLSMVFGFGNFYMLVRIFDKESYGVWMLFVSITALVEVARNGSFKNPLIRFLHTAADKDVAKLQSSSLIINVGFSLFIAVCLYVASFPLSTFWNIEGFNDLFFYYIITN